MNHKKLLAQRIAVAALLVGLLGATITWIVLCGPEAFAFFSDGARLQAWIDEQGLLAELLMLLMVIAQVFIAIIPGEPIELGAGYAFGFWEGTLLCLIGSCIGTVIAFLLTRSFGYRIIDLFGLREKIASVKWLQNSKRFEMLLFVIFLIPGTPKDMLTYVAALSSSPLHRIVAITTIGRIPSIISSTLASSFAAQGDWFATLITAGITIVLVGVGLIAYRIMSQRARKLDSTHESDTSAPRKEVVKPSADITAAHF